MTIAETLARLQDDHDEDPVAAARALRELDPVEVPRDEFARYSWLLNHVLGQKLGEWKEVQRRYGALAMPLASLPIAALRNADVDLAFILLELVHAEARLGNHETARGARERSESLSAAFPSDSLRDWYASRAAVLDGLPPKR